MWWKETKWKGKAKAASERKRIKGNWTWSLSDPQNSVWEGIIMKIGKKKWMIGKIMKI